MTEATQDTETTDTTEVSEDPKVETKTFTQDQVTAMIQKEINKAKAKVVKDEVDPLKAQLGTIDELRTAVETAASERDAAKSEAQAAASERNRLSVALKTGLPSDLIDRLKGDSIEDMEEDAKALLAFVKTAKNSSGFDGGPRPSAPKTSSEAEFGAVLLNASRR